MTGRSTPLDVEALRHAFDSSFARPAALELEAGVELIGVRLGERLFALPMAQIAGLKTGLRVTPCPSPVPELVGIAGVGGILTPVYDLAAALGLPAAAGRWTAMVEGGALALCFAEFVGHFRVDPAAITSWQGRSGAAHVSALASHAGREWSVIDVPAVVSAIRKRLPPATSKE